VHRADERFAMCSTFKWLLAAQVLAWVGQGQLRLEERIAYDAGDLLERHIRREERELFPLIEERLELENSDAVRERIDEILGRKD